MQAEMNALMGGKGGHGGDELLSADDKLGFGISEKRFDNTGGVNLKGF
jgi:hypothetical protein